MREIKPAIGSDHLEMWRLVFKIMENLAGEFVGKTAAHNQDGITGAGFLFDCLGYIRKIGDISRVGMFGGGGNIGTGKITGVSFAGSEDLRNNNLVGFGERGGKLR